MTLVNLEDFSVSDGNSAEQDYGVGGWDLPSAGSISIASGLDPMPSRKILKFVWEEDRTYPCPLTKSASRWDLVRTRC
jgi:hypothetical protein